MSVTDSNLLKLARELTLDIQTKEELQKHLQFALQIELTTIPLYLFAVYSIKDEYVSNTILSVAKEEMLHLGLAGNLLMSIGGQPVLYDKNVIPTFPGNFPYRIPSLELNLYPGKRENIYTFMQIELPENPLSPPEPGPFHTIGQYYKAIKDAFKKLAKDPNLFANARPAQQFTPNLFQPLVSDGGTFVVVQDLQSAEEAIRTIVVEGEGTSTSHFDDPGKLELAHYYKFETLYKGQDWDFYSVQENPTTESYADVKIKKVSQTFDAAYCFLLKVIENFYQGKNINNLWTVMTGILKPLALFLVQHPISETGTTVAAPCFGYYDFGSSDPVGELKKLIGEAIDMYQGQDRTTLEGVQDQINQLVQ